MRQGHEEEGSYEPRPAGPVGGAAAADSSGSDGADRVEQDLEALLADAEAKKDEYLELAKRTQADFENFRKRMSAEVLAAGVRGKAALAPGLIDAIDNLERAFEAKGIDPSTDPLDPDSGPTPHGFKHGVLLVLNGMREALRREGIEAVDPKGEKFDPNQHEALSTLPGPEGTEPGTVVEVLQKGYRLDEKLIRPARVVVSE